MFQETKELSVTEHVSSWHDLAEAIRRGCKVYPRQLFGKLTDEMSGACVVGAAQAGGYHHYIHEQIIGDGHCPLCNDSRVYSAWTVLPHLNDDHYMRRESIADWLDGKILQR